MSPDVIGVILAGATLVGGLFAGIWALMSRQTAKLEARFEGLERRFDARFANVDARFESGERRSDARFEKVDAHLTAIAVDLTDLKVAVARLEGPLPRLVTPR